ncbi:MAG: hypothetical protein ACK5Q1_02570, partial [Limnobacter sp.]
MKLSQFILPVAAYSSFAHAQNSNSTPDKDCQAVTQTVKQLVEKLMPGNLREMKKLFSPQCSGETIVKQYMTAELQHLHMVCYYTSKKEKLDAGGIVFFTPPQKNKFYNPEKSYDLLKDLESTNNSSSEQQYLIHKIGNDYAAVSLTSASPEKIQIFKNYFSKNEATTAAEVLLDKSKFIFHAGENEVPDFDRALYAMSLETALGSWLAEGMPFDVVYVSSHMLKTAVENDPDLKQSAAKILLRAIDQQGSNINIGYGANNFGMAVREAIGSIRDKCPAKFNAEES